MASGSMNREQFLSIYYNELIDPNTLISVKSV